MDEREMLTERLARHGLRWESSPEWVQRAAWYVFRRRLLFEAACLRLIGLGCRGIHFAIFGPILWVLDALLVKVKRLALRQELRERRRIEKRLDAARRN